MGLWTKYKPSVAPVITLSFAISRRGFKGFGLPRYSKQIKTAQSAALPDTGAMVTACGPDLPLKMGIDSRDFIPVAQQLNSANGEGVKVLGAMLMIISGEDHNGQKISAKEMVYVINTTNTESVLLSLDLCRGLGIISTDFPTCCKFMEHKDMRST